MMMKVLLRIATFVIIVSLALPFASCSKKGYGGKSYAKRNTSSPTIDPVSRKSEPVRKTYLIPAKKKRILGQNKPKI
jgi:hypothetical protein